MIQTSRVTHFNMQEAVVCRHPRVPMRVLDVPAGAPRPVPGEMDNT